MDSMYLDAMEFLEDERDQWRRYEALGDLSDDQLSTPVDGAHGWSGRDLLAHVLAWQGVALDVARELAVGESSPTIARIDAEWETLGGDAVNEAITLDWQGRSLEELRERLRTQPGELRGYLTVVPEIRWVKHADHQRTFREETVEHYEEHLPDLEAILAAARG
jgi:hypothetical protein